jgi:uncharacterized protein involved in high-affinity Fe2+ transport
MKSILRRLLAPALLLTLTVGLAACTPASQPSGSESTGGNVPAPGEAPGFTEYPIGDPISLPPLEVAAVYFQPVDMEPAGMGLPAAQSDMHIEADIAAGPNELGYGVGDFVPNLTVDYEITAEDGKVADSGTFMPMNATDGPHYGANIALPNAGTYQVKFIIHSPAESGHVLHVDPETGVTGKFWTTPLVAEWTFDYIPREW